ncbi:hypothetical protein [Nocardia sp. NPDC049149]|uniref:hypothetical protein n=1 Tax=Nocardia sp. NPDC049149 TaxID=3364315 RepID=UPI00371ED41D
MTVPLAKLGIASLAALLTTLLSSATAAADNHILVGYTGGLGPAAGCKYPVWVGDHLPSPQPSVDVDGVPIGPVTLDAGSWSAPWQPAWLGRYTIRSVQRYDDGRIAEYTSVVEVSRLGIPGVGSSCDGNSGTGHDFT